jgi:arginyl-tRNA synthetase
LQQKRVQQRTPLHHHGFATKKKTTTDMETFPLAGIDQLVKSAEGLSIETCKDSFTNCYPDVNPYDVYRAHLANVLSEITGVSKQIVYPAIAWTTGLDKGDLVLPVPALRIKGKKPDELAKEWGDKV